jgi:hypothetical protein
MSDFIGLKNISVNDTIRNLFFPGMVFYPTDAPSKMETEAHPRTSLVVGSGETSARNGFAHVPDRSRVDYEVIKNANHFSFLSPFPESQIKTHFPPAMDAPGFDRPAFHRWLAQRLLTFLK